MRIRFVTISLFLAATVMTAPTPTAAQDTAADRFLWLEDVEGERALAWVEARNAAALAELQAHPLFEPIRQDMLHILTRQDRIAFPSTRGDVVYNLEPFI